jgi:Protein of unknown function (DUF3231)
MNNSNDTEHYTRLTASELASLWTQYINDSMNICVKKYVLEKVEDAEIRGVVRLRNDHIPVTYPKSHGIFRSGTPSHSCGLHR